ncbi:MAG: DUF1549 and DUF1553 domain-containing protein [Pirellulales bacterium]
MDTDLHRTNGIWLRALAGSLAWGILWGSFAWCSTAATAWSAETDGDAQAQADSQTEAQAEAAAESIPWEFRRHVLPVLTKAGCNSGACHGALAGKGGFKLSLRGYDPQGDYVAITQQGRGRRIESTDPARSLLLAKPTTQLPHKGGLRLDPQSADYRLLVEWIEQGVAGPRADDPNLVELSVIPPMASAAVGDELQLTVLARYSDNRVEDVTRWAKFSSADESVVQVTDGGQVKVLGPGDGAVVVWFSSQIVLARVMSPYPYQVAPEVYEQAAARNFVDRLVLERLQALNLAPSPRSSDAEFLRRMYLSLLGTLPTEQEVQEFLSDSHPDKRDRWIDQALARSEFNDYWSYRWSDVLLVNGRRLRPAAVEAYSKWIHERVSRNQPWDEFVREIVVASGSTLENGAANFYSLHQDPEGMTENACQAFLGLSIGCARCHNHPLEKWTNDQYYAMASHFARVRAKGWGGDPRGGDGNRSVFVANDGELIQPLRGKPQPPTPLDGTPLDFDAPGDRREHLSEWLTSPENPYFTRAVVNRVWAALFGIGLVEPVDDLRASNPASNERLLQALSDYLVEQDYDLKALMKLILQSETFQRSGEPLAENAGDKRYFSHYFAYRLPAEVLLDAIAQVTEVPSEFTQIGYDGSDVEQTTRYPMGTRAIQLADSAVVSNFLKAFGRNERDITCECERSNTPSLVQVLHISNGTTINDRLENPRSCVSRWAGDQRPWPEIVRSIYLRSLGRLPTEAEESGLLSELESVPAEQRREAIEDLYWSVLSSREFLFNH